MAQPAREMPTTQESRLLNLVDKALASLESTVQADVDVIHCDLQALESVNRHVTGGYRQMADAAEGLRTDADHLDHTHASIDAYVEKLDLVKEQVTQLELFVGELDAWSKQLESKCVNA